MADKRDVIPTAHRLLPQATWKEPDSRGSLADPTFHRNLPYNTTAFAVLTTLVLQGVKI